jgi:uncharacterized membrane protein YidH (DUF202 family)
MNAEVTMANERTTLAWIRTALGMAALAILLVKLDASSTSKSSRLLAILAGVVSLVLTSMGIWHFIKTRKEYGQSHYIDILVAFLAVGLFLIGLLVWIYTAH